VKSPPFWVEKENVFAVPILHYKMESAYSVHAAFQAIQPTCIAVELPENQQLQMLHAASRLPDISVVVTFNKQLEPLYTLAEPCEATFEGLRLGIDAELPTFCIDYDVDQYPEVFETLPDSYSISKIGLKSYYDAYLQSGAHQQKRSPFDKERELYMAKRLRELSLQHDRVLFVTGMFHLEAILENFDRPHFPDFRNTSHDAIQVCTLTEESLREVMPESGWTSSQYEESRGGSLPDRQELLLKLFREAGSSYKENTGETFPSGRTRTLMKFLRNYSLITGALSPDLFQTVSAAKGCVDHNYAYETWELATRYPYLKNVDGLDELDLTAKELWGKSKTVHFHLKEKSKKQVQQARRVRKNRANARLFPPGPFSICSYPPEDVSVENFGEFLKKKGCQILSEEGSKTVPFSTSVEDGIDMRETIRHFTEKKLYVKVHGKPPGGVGSVVMIFDEDQPQDEENQGEAYPWRTTWLGEHEQESDMAFYATPMTDNVVGPGISRCEYGGFMMSYPPRRMYDVWTDPDYFNCRSKSEVLLMAAIDYAVQPLITYVAAKPPRSSLKSYAQRFGKKVVYLPLGQLSPVTLSKIRRFHVLDSHEKRSIADEYIS